MKTTCKTLSAFTLILTLLWSGCKKKEDPEPEPEFGTVTGTITEANTDTALSGVIITVFKANSNEPTGKTVKSDAQGNYSIELPGGIYYLRLQKQSFNRVPPPGITAISFTILNGGTVSQDYAMHASNTTNTGYITGTVTSSGGPVAGALVVAEQGITAFSSITDADGNYSIFNVPAGTYQVNSWKSGYQGNQVSASVVQDQELTNVDITMNKITGQNVSGMITFLATTNINVDVALVHPVTRETIPGLITTTSGGSYSISRVPDGLYLGRATFENDGKVVDPDWIVKNGEPLITVSGSSVSLDFSVTGAITLNSPTNPPASVIPVVVTSTSPTFSWTAYSSASDYVIEVSDASGNVLWGGFSNGWDTKNITIPKSQMSIPFNSDGNATAMLEDGKIYRWRVYASKDDAQSPSGFRLISVSEDQTGLIVVKL